MSRLDKRAKINKRALHPKAFHKAAKTIHIRHLRQESSEEEVLRSKWIQILQAPSQRKI